MDKVRHNLESGLHNKSNMYKNVLSNSSEQFNNVAIICKIQPSKAISIDIITYFR